MDAETVLTCGSRMGAFAADRLHHLRQPGLKVLDLHFQVGDSLLVRLDELPGDLHAERSAADDHAIGFQLADGAGSGVHGYVVLLREGLQGREPVALLDPASADLPAQMLSDLLVLRPPVVRVEQRRGPWHEPTLMQALTSRKLPGAESRFSVWRLTSMKMLILRYCTAGHQVIRYPRAHGSGSAGGGRITRTDADALHPAERDACQARRPPAPATA